MASTIKVNNVQASDGGNIINQCGTTITLGASGDTINLASGASQSGFGRTGTVDWQTGSIKTGTFTAANGEGYFANTSGGAFTMNLPAGSAGNIVSVVDYTNSFQTHNLTVAPNGTDKIGGSNANATLSTEGQSVTFVYVDGVEGWKNIQDSTSNVIGETFVTATVSGACNTLTTAPDCANVKIATFVNPGTFNVTGIATNTLENTVGYMVVAGGGAGGAGVGSGGGAGGFREGRNVPVDNFTASPLVADFPGPNCNAVTVSVAPYTITVGGGGAGGPDGFAGGSGVNSTFSSITSAGGGGGNAYQEPPGSPSGVPGGSGGGGTYIFPGSPGPHTTPPAQIGVGNTPPVTPPQGNPGGNGAVNWTPFVSTGGGGGAGANGGTPGGAGGGPGGAGVSSSITGASVARAGGGGGGVSQSGSGGSGGTGGGGAAGNLPAGAGTAGTANTGGGSGGSADKPGVDGVNGGSGIVIIRYKFQ